MIELTFRRDFSSENSGLGARGLFWRVGLIGGKTMALK